MYIFSSSVTLRVQIKKKVYPTILAVTMIGKVELRHSFPGAKSAYESDSDSERRHRGFIGVYSRTASSTEQELPWNWSCECMYACENALHLCVCTY
jgi:hypothetical protein